MSGTVVVVGSLNLDLTVVTDRLPKGGETLLSPRAIRSPGGKGANQAVGAARAGGATTAMIGAVGSDSEGDLLLAALHGDGVDVSAVDRLADVPTGIALITVDGGGENTIVVAAGANAQVSIGDRARALVESADVVLAQLEIPQHAVVEAARHRRHGVPLVLNAAPSADLHPDLADAVDVLLVNEHEALDLTPLDDVDQAVDALALTFPTVVVTLGAAGARLVRRDGTDLRVAAPAVAAVDTVAAGDTFAGVFAAALANGSDDLTSLQKACAAASLAVQRAGAQVSIPTAAETADQVAAVYG